MTYLSKSFFIENYEYAKTVLTNFEASHTGSVIVLLRKTGVELRRAMSKSSLDNDEPCDYSLVCKEFETLIAEAKSIKIATFFAIKYARFHEKVFFK